MVMTIGGVVVVVRCEPDQRENRQDNCAGSLTPLPDSETEYNWEWERRVAKRLRESPNYLQHDAHWHWPHHVVARRVALQQEGEFVRWRRVMAW